MPGCKPLYGCPTVNRATGPQAMVHGSEFRFFIHNGSAEGGSGGEKFPAGTGSRTTIITHNFPVFPSQKPDIRAVRFSMEPVQENFLSPTDPPTVFSFFRLIRAGFTPEICDHTRSWGKGGSEGEIRTGMDLHGPPLISGRSLVQGAISIAQNALSGSALHDINAGATGIKYKRSIG